MVCARNLSTSGPTDEEIREQLTRERLDLMARGYLRDLRRTSFVDIRGSWPRPTREASAASASLPPLREVIARHGLGADAVARPELPARPQPDRAHRPRRRRSDAAARCIEIGPGPGGLTRALLDTGAAQVIAIERDRALPRGAGGDRRGLSRPADGDRGRRARGRCCRARPAPRAASSPTCPTMSRTALLLRWLRRARLVRQPDADVPEGSRRPAAAAPGSKAYGRLSVLAQWRARCARAVRHLAAAPSRRRPR